MSALQAALLGLVEGITEFLPVSSTAHMLLVQSLTGNASSGNEAFLVLVQLAPIAALVLYFWQDLLILVRAFFARPFSSPPNKLAWYVIIATVPALGAGYILRNAFSALLRVPLTEASIRFLAAAVLLFLAESLGSRKRALESMSWLDALFVGFFQILAVFPGSSRSGSAISGGMLRGLGRPAATRFAFLMAVPVMGAAGVYESYSVFRSGGMSTLTLPLAVGWIVAGIAGWLCIRWMLAFVGNHSLKLFSYYCAAMGIICVSLALFWHM